VNSAGQIQIVDKKEIKKDLGRSPDIAEAIIYAFAEPSDKKGVYLGFSERDVY